MSEREWVADLQELDAVMREEASGDIHESQVVRKEAALSRLQALLDRGESIEDGEELAGKMRELMASNRFSLKWSALRLQLSRLGQAKPEPPDDRPRLDLVH